MLLGKDNMMICCLHERGDGYLPNSMDLLNCEIAIARFNLEWLSDGKDRFGKNTKL